MSAAGLVQHWSAVLYLGPSYSWEIIPSTTPVMLTLRMRGHRAGMEKSLSHHETTIHQATAFSYWKHLTKAWAPSKTRRSNLPIAPGLVQMSGKGEFDYFYLSETYEASVCVGCSEWLVSMQPLTWKAPLPDFLWVAKASACHCSPANYR